MLNKLFALAAALTLFTIAACSSKGTFAYKTFDMDSYRNMGEHFEFPSDKPFDWTCKLASSPGSKKVTVIIQKKELVWVDIAKSSQNYIKTSPFIHGRVENYEPGTYKIILVGGEKIAAEYEFRLYNSEYPEKTEE